MMNLPVSAYCSSTDATVPSPSNPMSPIIPKPKQYIEMPVNWRQLLHLWQSWGDSPLPIEREISTMDGKLVNRGDGHHDGNIIRVTLPFMRGSVKHLREWIDDFMQHDYKMFAQYSITAYKYRYTEVFVSLAFEFSNEDIDSAMLFKMMHYNNPIFAA